MPWKFRGDSDDPVEKRRRQLEQQQQRLAAEMADLQAKLEAERNPPPVEKVDPGPPVWHLEEEESFVREEEPFDAGKSKRVLRAQRERDFRLFLFLFIGLGLVVCWLIYAFA